jgi:uncharacterized protein (DUF362 family)/NAD-dependent dihydropyrimidine dehydrogenase PreA subunit
VLTVDPSLVTVTPCPTYDFNSVRTALRECLAPLGGMQRFVHPGMRVLLKPNLLTATPIEKGVTTHPAIVEVVGELVQAAGGEVWIGDSPAAPINEGYDVWQVSGMQAVAEKLNARILPFEGARKKDVNGHDYFIARPIFEADLVINLPKLKTHTLTLYTGAVKNLFGVITGGRKRELHVRAPGVTDFSKILVDILELVKPQLNIMDGVLGLEGYGPGTGGTPHPYKIMAASTDAVALDSVLSSAMGFKTGEVLHLAQAENRGLGAYQSESIRVESQPETLNFGKVSLPKGMRLLDVPSWLSAPLQGQIKLTPQIDPAKCTGCGTCVDACPADVITKAQPAQFDLSRCIGCMCCVEVCPQSALSPKRNWLAKLVGVH